MDYRGELRALDAREDLEALERFDGFDGFEDFAVLSAFAWQTSV